MKDKTLLIAGAYPPDKCGIGDYTHELHLAGNKILDLYLTKDNRINRICKIIKEVNSFNTKYINLQYPSAPFYSNIIPHVLCIYYSLFTSKRFSITIHELSRMSVLYQILAHLFLIFSNEVIFTTDYERMCAKRFIRWRKFNVIKLYSNIKRADYKTDLAKREYDLAYFGLVSQGKGIEMFIDVVKEINNNKYRCAIVGMLNKDDYVFFDKIQDLAHNTNIEFIIDNSNEDVAKFLANTKFVFLPFDDGISERRGSFLAAINNNAIVITKKGKCTPDSFQQVCYYINDTTAATDVSYILEHQKSQEKMIVHADIEYFLSNNYPESWHAVALAYHAILYNG